MLSKLSAKEKLGYMGIAILLIGAMGFIGARQFKPHAEIKIAPQTQEPPQQSANPKASEPELLIDIAGAVNYPGVYKFKSGDRVIDALAMAGGVKPNADLEAVNQAGQLVDGTQLYVPFKDESGASTRPKDNRYLSDRVSSTSSSSNLPAPESISLNTATAEELNRLPGVGPAIAQSIIEYRIAHQGFVSIDELLNIKGIGQKNLAAMRKYLRL